MLGNSRGRPSEASATQTREAAGDHQGAVDFYLRATAAATGLQRQDVLLQATTSLIQLGEYNRAIAILDSIAAPELWPPAVFGMPDIVTES